MKIYTSIIAAFATLCVLPNPLYAHLLNSDSNSQSTSHVEKKRTYSSSASFSTTSTALVGPGLGIPFNIGKNTNDLKIFLDSRTGDTAILVSDGVYMVTYNAVFRDFVPIALTIDGVQCESTINTNPLGRIINASSLAQYLGYPDVVTGSETASITFLKLADCHDCDD